MDKKLKERNIVDHIYGDLPLLELMDSESPDFLAKSSDQIIFGVEVTELTTQPDRLKLCKEAQHVYASLDESLLKVIREVVEKRPQIIRYLPTYKTLAI